VACFVSRPFAGFRRVASGTQHGAWNWWEREFEGNYEKISMAGIWLDVETLGFLRHFIFHPLIGGFAAPTVRYLFFHCISDDLFRYGLLPAVGSRCFPALKVALARIKSRCRPNFPLFSRRLLTFPTPNTPDGLPGGAVSRPRASHPASRPSQGLWNRRTGALRSAAEPVFHSKGRRRGSAVRGPC